MKCRSVVMLFPNGYYNPDFCCRNNNFHHIRRMKKSISNSDKIRIRIMQVHFPPTKAIRIRPPHDMAWWWRLAVDVMLPHSHITIQAAIWTPFIILPLRKIRVSWRSIQNPSDDSEDDALCEATITCFFISHEGNLRNSSHGANEHEKGLSQENRNGTT